VTERHTRIRAGANDLIGDETGLLTKEWQHSAWPRSITVSMLPGWNR
jgi:hypothetical protein